MTARSSTRDAEALTAAVVDFDGVRGLFPEHVINAILPALAGGAGTAAPALIGVEADDSGTVVRARLALDRSVPSAVTLLAVRDAAVRLLGTEVRVDLEVSYID